MAKVHYNGVQSYDSVYLASKTKPSIVAGIFLTELKGENNVLVFKDPVDDTKFTVTLESDMEIFMAKTKEAVEAWIKGEEHKKQPELTAVSLHDSVYYIKVGEYVLREAIVTKLREKDYKKVDQFDIQFIEPISEEHGDGWERGPQTQKKYVTLGEYYCPPDTRCGGDSNTRYYIGKTEQECKDYIVDYIKEEVAALSAKTSMLNDLIEKYA